MISNGVQATEEQLQPPASENLVPLKQVDPLFGPQAVGFGSEHSNLPSGLNNTVNPPGLNTPRLRPILKRRETGGAGSRRASMVRTASGEAEQDELRTPIEIRQLEWPIQAVQIGSPSSEVPPQVINRRVSFTAETPLHSVNEILQAQMKLGIIASQEASNAIADKVSLSTQIQQTVVAAARRSSLSGIVFSKRRSSIIEETEVKPKSPSASSSPLAAPNQKPESDQASSCTPIKSSTSFETDEEDVAFLKARTLAVGSMLTGKTIIRLKEEDIDETDREGYLYQKKWRFLVKDEWKPRYCILKNHRLFVMKNVDLLEAREVINLKHCVLDTYMEKRDSFVIHRLGHYKSYYFQAEDGSTKIAWMEDLLKSIFKAWRQQQLLSNEERQLSSLDFLNWHTTVLHANKENFQSSDAKVSEIEEEVDDIDEAITKPDVKNSLENVKIKTPSHEEEPIVQIVTDTPQIVTEIRIDKISDANVRGALNRRIGSTSNSLQTDKISASVSNFSISSRLSVQTAGAHKDDDLKSLSEYVRALSCQNLS